MSVQNTYDYSADSDKCPNCGAMKVFSALVCPACGMSYSDASSIKKESDSKPKNFYRDETETEEKKDAAKTAFDPNASFAKFKSSLEADTQNNGASEDKNKTNETSENEEEIQVIQEETGRKTLDIQEASPERPENNPANSGLYGERRFRVGDDLSKAAKYSDNKSEPEPDRTVVPTRYGLDSEVVKQKREQSLNDEAGKQKMFSNSVSQRYEQYRADRDSSIAQPAYSSPYSRGSFDIEPEKKPNVWAKILPLAAVLVLVIVAGIFVAKFINREKNENGVSYESGNFNSNGYVNDWAEIRFKFDDKMENAPSMVYSFTNSAYGSLSNKDASIELNLYALYNESPAVVMMSYADGSLFGMEEKDFADSDQLDQLVASGESNLRIEPDMLLGSHTYKAISAETEYEDGKKMRMYLCYRKIGNRINIIFIYDVPGVTDLNTIKKYFQTY